MYMLGQKFAKKKKNLNNKQIGLSQAGKFSARTSLNIDVIGDSWRI